MINWDITQAAAITKGEAFASSHTHSTIANAFIQGYLENAAERESLRIINARLEAEKEAAKVPALPVDKILETCTTESLDSFI